MRKSIFLITLLLISGLIIGVNGAVISNQNDYINFDKIYGNEYYLNSVDVTEHLEGNFTDSGVITPWLSLNGDNRTSWPTGGSGAVGAGTFDYYMNKTGSNYNCYDKDWNLDYSNSDFGTAFNWVMDTIVEDGIVCIQGGITYSYAVQPWVNGTGSGLAKNIEIVGVGGGNWPILSPTGDNIHGLRVSGGANLHLHQINFAMKTTGTSGSAIYGTNAGGNAYDENALFMSKIGDIKITGGTSGVDLIYLEDTEWVEYYGQIYINGASGTNGFHSKITSGAQYHYGSNLISGQMYISLTGDNTYGIWLQGYNDTLSHMNFRCTGRLWVVNDVSDDNVTGLIMYRCAGSEIDGFMTERCTKALVMTYCKSCVISAGGLTHLPRITAPSNLADATFFDLDGTGNYANTLENIKVTYTGSGTYYILNITQTDANAPNMISNWTFHLTGGTFLSNISTQTYECEDFGSGRWYRKLGTGTYP
jgi:hypothetical protein